MIRIGIDVGGTNTDAVMMDGPDVLAAIKAPTTQGRHLRRAPGDAGRDRPVRPRRGRRGPRDDRDHHFTNAVIERRRLSKVAAIRLGLPAAACLPPMVDWPEDLRAAVGDLGYMLRGGFEYDGRALSELDAEGLDRIAGEIEAMGVGAAAITSIFGPVNPAMELEARRMLSSGCPISTWYCPPTSGGSDFSSVKARRS